MRSFCFLIASHFISRIHSQSPLQTDFEVLKGALGGVLTEKIHAIFEGRTFTKKFQILTYKHDLQNPNYICFLLLPIKSKPKFSELSKLKE